MATAGLGDELAAIGPLDAGFHGLEFLICLRVPRAWSVA
jgi:hypothetical protein